MDSIKTTKRILKHSNLTAKILAVESHFVAGYIVKECINMSLVQKLETRREGRLFIKQLKRTKIKWEKFPNLSSPNCIHSCILVVSSNGTFSPDTSMN